MRIFIDHGGTGNLGDSAMLEGVVLRLHRIDPCLTLCVRDRPGLRTNIWDWDRVTPVTLEITNAIENVPSVHRIPYFWRYEKPWQATWRNGCYALLDRLIDPRQIPMQESDSLSTLDAFCQRYDALHIVGGGNLTDTFPDELWQRCCLIHAFAAQKKPVVLTGQQIGPFRTWWTRDSLRRALRRAAFVGLREPTDSLDFCKRARLWPDCYAVMGDDSFGLEPSDSSEVETFLTRYRLSPGRFLAVNVRIGSYVPSTQHYVRYFAQLVSGLAREYELPVVVVPISLDRDDNDIASGYTLKRAVGGDVVQVLDDPEFTPRLGKGVLGKAYGAVGVSYHFCTFALAQGVPALCVFDGEYYLQKARGLARFWEDDRLSLPLRECGTGTALEKAAILFNDARFRDVLRVRAATAVEKWKSIIDQIALSHLLGSRKRAAVC